MPIARGYQFHALDLRWGVSEEAQLDGRTAEICLGEVRAAKGYPPPNVPKSAIDFRVRRSTIAAFV